MQRRTNVYYNRYVIKTYFLKYELLLRNLKEKVIVTAFNSVKQNTT